MVWNASKMLKNWPKKKSPYTALGWSRTIKLIGAQNGTMACWGWFNEHFLGKLVEIIQISSKFCRISSTFLIEPAPNARQILILKNWGDEKDVLERRHTSLHEIGIIKTCLNIRLRLQRFCTLYAIRCRLLWYPNSGKHPTALVPPY